MKRGYNSQQSFFPQITAVAGATVASLGTFLFTDQQQPFGIAALTGSTAGFVIGSRLQKQGKQNRFLFKHDRILIFLH